jgi:glycosyltransferase involved in cell wall biosynthesis
MGPLKAASSVIFLWPPLAITTINDRGNICGVASTFKGVDYQQYDMMSCTNICLNMIVKNESHNLHRLFKSVFPFIDRYAIQDTGSTDDTVKQIQTWFQQGWNHYFPVEHGDTVQGIVEQTEWRGDFALHRNQALDIARTSGCEYVLIIDADEELVTENRYWWNDTERKDVACIAKRDGTIESWLPVIFRLRPGFASWKGFVHNDIVFSQPCQNVVVKEAYIAYRSDELSGAKSHRHKNAIEKYREDANRIRQAGKEDDPRMTFYLAKSLMDASDLDEALQIFSKRVRMGGFEEEVFLSYLYMASITWTRLSDGNEAQVISFIHKAIESCPRREIEALYFLVRFFRMTKRPWLAKLYCACALQCRVEFYPTLFVERRAYDQWSLWEELGVACAAVGSLHEARTAFNHALKNTPETTMKEKLVCNIQKIDAFISRDDYRYSA